jgi:hypothetical protein
MSEKKSTVIEIVADYLYLALIGKKCDLERYIKEIKKDNDLNYLVTRVDISISFKINQLEKQFGKIIIDDGIERAQSYIYAQCKIINNKKYNDKYIDKKYMLLCLEKHTDYYLLKFPKLDLVDDDDPEKIICNWIQCNNSMANINNIKKSMKPISLVGYNDEILVYTAKI